MADISLRPARSEHIDDVARLWHLTWHEAHAALVPEALTAARTRDSFHIRVARHLERFIVAASDDELLGFVKTAGAELDQLFCAPAARGTGLATRLLSEGERQILSSGHTNAFLLCAIGNIRAARFYEKSGWRRARTQTAEVELVEGRFPLEVWRYEKDLTR